MLPPNLPPPRARDDDPAPGPYLRRLRDAPHDTLQRLGEEAPSRPATSLGEARAAAYLDGRMRRAGLRVSADTFRTRPLPGFDALVAAALALASVGAYYWQPLPALLLGAAALALTAAQAIRAGRPLFGRTGTSQNVIATRAAADRQETRLVLLAALDTPDELSERWATGPAALAVRAAAAAALVAAQLGGVAAPARPWLYAQVPTLAVLLGAAAITVLSLLGRGRGGSARAGAGLGVLLAGCESLDDLKYTELWAVGLGATSSGAGLEDLLRRYPFDKETLFMALDALGDGEPGIAVREGWPTPRSADAELGEVAGMAGEDPNVRMRPLSYPGRTRIGSALLGLGRRALTVACLGPGQRQGGPDSLALERAVRLVVGVARRVDAEHAQATRG